jgi:hypothetical protein
VRREIGDEIDPQRWRTVFVVNLSRFGSTATLTTIDGSTRTAACRGPPFRSPSARDLEQHAWRPKFTRAA